MMYGRKCPLDLPGASPVPSAAADVAVKPREKTDFGLPRIRASKSLAVNDLRLRVACFRQNGFGIQYRKTKYLPCFQQLSFRELQISKSGRLRLGRGNKMSRENYSRDLSARQIRAFSTLAKTGAGCASFPSQVVGGLSAAPRHRA